MPPSCSSIPKPITRARCSPRRSILTPRRPAWSRSSSSARPRDPPTLVPSYVGFESAEAHSAKAEGGDPALPSTLDCRFRRNERSLLLRRGRGHLARRQDAECEDRYLVTRLERSRDLVLDPGTL